MKHDKFSTAKSAFKLALPFLICMVLGLVFYFNLAHSIFTGNASLSTQLFFSFYATFFFAAGPVLLDTFWLCRIRLE